MLEDGSAPPERVRVELICDNQIEPQAFTKSDGGFIFRVGGNQALEVHAGSAHTTHPSSEPKPSGSLGFYTMNNCEVRAVLAGYRSSKIQLGRRSAFESPDIGVIVLYGLGTARSPLVSVTTSYVSPEILEVYQEAEKELAKEEPDVKKASRELLKAVEEYPEFSTAWNLLAEARIRMDDLEGARDALKKAIDIDPEFATPCVTLALLELKQGNAVEAAAASAKAIQLMPDHAEAHFYHGMATSNLGDLAKAEESLRVVLGSPEADRFPRAHFLLGSVLAQEGQLQDAASHYQRYLELEPDSRAAAAVRAELEQWEDSGLIR
jgi:tetratricopeptide (TPR) repeat protein